MLSPALLHRRKVVSYFSITSTATPSLGRIYEAGPALCISCACQITGEGRRRREIESNIFLGKRERASFGCHQSAGGIAAAALYMDGGSDENRDFLSFFHRRSNLVERASGGAPNRTLKSNDIGDCFCADAGVHKRAPLFAGPKVFTRKGGFFFVVVSVFAWRFMGGPEIHK